MSDFQVLGRTGGFEVLDRTMNEPFRTVMFEGYSIEPSAKSYTVAHAGTQVDNIFLTEPPRGLRQEEAIDLLVRLAQLQQRPTTYTTGWDGVWVTVDRNSNVETLRRAVLGALIDDRKKHVNKALLTGQVGLDDLV